METVRIIEVSPRDGLQNEATPIPVAQKLELIENLVNAGLSEIEVSSFVSAKWVPQLGDIEELWPLLPSGATYSALVPNSKGLERALQLGVSRIAIFTAASSAFTLKNINRTVEQSLEEFEALIVEFRSQMPSGWIRGYISTIFECPYAGKIEPEQVQNVAERLLSIGVDEISLGDTTGVGCPSEVKRLASVISDIDHQKVAWHFHDTRGTGIANVSTAFDLGYRSFDSSAGGLGGCPYAKGAGGNVATEDLVYFFERSGISTGVDLELLAHASLPVLQTLGRKPVAKAQLATLAVSNSSNS